MFMYTDEAPTMIAVPQQARPALVQPMNETVITIHEDGEDKTRVMRIQTLPDGRMEIEIGKPEEYGFRSYYR